MKMLTSLSSNEITIRKFSISNNIIKNSFIEIRRSLFEAMLQRRMLNDIRHNMLWHRTLRAVIQKQIREITFIRIDDL